VYGTILILIPPFSFLDVVSISVQIWLMYSKHSPFVLLLPASVQPKAFSRLADHIEYCPSWFTTTV
jgi:hypothetical protein